jgi:2-succinyl-5-enolpyruvyl-6-hydroxy-3-cyclohexene-1-carboxylate synthase
MPIRDQEAFLPSTAADATFLCNRGANGIDGLISSGVGRARASGRPTTIVTGDLGLLHDIGALAARARGGIPGAHRRHRQRRRRDIPLPAAGASIGRRGVRSSPRHDPRGVDVAKAGGPLFDLHHRHLDSLSELSDALAAGTGLIEVRTDRQANAALHRRLADRVSAALD